MTDIKPHRIPATDGDRLDSRDKDYSATLYRWFHGREINLLELGCYLSHVKAMRAFLATDAPLAMICEDDILIKPGLEDVLKGAFRYAKYWNILRLTGLTEGRSLKVARSDNKHSLCLSLGRLKGAGAYLVDRTAAQIFVERLLPMRLPFDHAVDREWFYGLNAVYILPFPISQSEKRFSSQIQTKSKPKFSFLRRSLFYLSLPDRQRGDEMDIQVDPFCADEIRGAPAKGLAVLEEIRAASLVAGQDIREANERSFAREGEMLQRKLR